MSDTTREVFEEMLQLSKTKLKRGQTFSKPQEKLNRIYEIFTEDMSCAFCDSYLYEEIAKVVGYDKYS